MKRSIFAIAAIASLLCAFTLSAQEKKEEKKKKKHAITLGMDGLQIRERDSVHGVTVHDERDDEDDEALDRLVGDLLAPA